MPEEPSLLSIERESPDLTSKIRALKELAVKSKAKLHEAEVAYGLAQNSLNTRNDAYNVVLDAIFHAQKEQMLSESDNSKAEEVAVSISPD